MRLSDRAAILARIADEYMAGKGLPLQVPGVRSLRVETWPREQPREYRFAAEWPGITIVCSRPLVNTITP